jgi:hypothetical protein
MSTMRAIQVHAYGDANQLRLEQISQPEPQEGEVLVHVYAAGPENIFEQVFAPLYGAKGETR